MFMKPVEVFSWLDAWCALPYGQASDTARSGIQRLLVFFSAAILGELNDKENYRSHQKEMHHAAFVQKKFGDEPANEQQTAGKPEHRFTNSMRGYSKAWRGRGRCGTRTLRVISRARRPCHSIFREIRRPANRCGSALRQSVEVPSRKERQAGRATRMTSHDSWPVQRLPHLSR